MRTLSAAAVLLLCVSGTFVQNASAQVAKPRSANSAMSTSAGVRTHQPQISELRGGGGGDDCASAQSLTVGSSCVTVSGNTIGATESLAPILCNGFTASAADDVWFSFTATAASTTISAVGVDDFDVVMEVFSGTCGSLVSMGCSDATFPPGGLSETFIASTTAGQTYYVRIYCYTPPANVSTSFTICAYSAGGGTPANDDCAGSVTQALSIGSSVTFNGDNTGATDTETLGVPSVWESFTITECADLTLAYCGTTPAFQNAFLNLFVGCPFTSFLPSESFEVTSCGDGNVTIQYVGIPAGTYYYAVLTEPGATGPYTIEVSAVACGGGTGPCTAGADGTGLGLDERIINVAMADINNASPDAAPVAPAYSDFTSVVGNVTAGQDYTIDIDVARAGANTSYSENQALVWIDFNQDDDFDDVGEQVFVSAIGSVDVYSGTISIPAGATLGTTIMRIRLHDTHDGTSYINNFNDTPCGLASYGEVEDYTLNITGGGGPANDDCAGSVTQALSIGSSITFNGDNTGATDTEGLGVPSVWESFTITECADLTLSYCGTTPAFQNAFLNLFVGCPFTSFIGSASFETTSCGDGNVTIQYVGVPAGTYYYAVLTEPGATGPYTIEVSAVACAPAGPYCDAGANGDGDFDLEERIINVTFSNINNDSPDVIPVDPAYQDFTSVVGEVVGGQTYPIAIDVAREGANTSYSENQVIVWIDFNQDGDFFDSGELVFTSAIGSVDIYTGNIAIPATASLGTTRMRIRLHDTHDGSAYVNNFNDTPCGLSSYGEVEDYTIDVIGIITGVSEASVANWSVFPNPSNGDFSVRYDGRDGRATIEVLDMTGRMVHAEQRAVSAGSILPLSLAGEVSVGTYVLRITTAEGSAERRIVVQ